MQFYYYHILQTESWSRNTRRTMSCEYECVSCPRSTCVELSHACSRSLSLSSFFFMASHGSLALSLPPFSLAPHPRPAHFHHVYSVFTARQFDFPQQPFSSFGTSRDGGTGNVEHPREERAPTHAEYKAGIHKIATTTMSPTPTQGL